MAFVAAIGTYNPGTREVVGHDIEEQTAQVFGNFAAVLERNGSGLPKVVSCSGSLADIERGWKAFDPTYGSFFLSPYLHELASGPALKDSGRDTGYRRGRTMSFSRLVLPAAWTIERLRACLLHDSWSLPREPRRSGLSPSCLRRRGRGQPI